MRNFLNDFFFFNIIEKNVNCQRNKILFSSFQVDLRSEKRFSDTIVKKGLLWIQQDKLFSSWKERFVILTNSHLQIFKKGTTKFSEMGAFINKVKRNLMFFSIFQYIYKFLSGARRCSSLYIFII